MTNRWILGISQILVLIYCLHSTSLQAARLDAYMVVRWEGRALEEPNLEALDAIRKKFPDVPAIHLINPAYFKDNPQIASNLEQIKKRIGDADEVGLYIVPSASLVKAADIVAIRKPTFWGYGEELCTNDCGLQVPATVYSRNDITKLFLAAHNSLREAGFTDAKTFAVHGWIAPAGIAEIAQGLGYANDLTGIDIALVKEQLKEYPLADWLKAAPLPASTAAVSAWIQAGGVLEFNNDEEVLKRFDQFFARDHARQSLFLLSLSQENAYMSRSRLVKSIEGMKKKAEAGNDTLVFNTMINGKNGRPVAEKVSISRKL